MSKTALTQ